MSELIEFGLLQPKTNEVEAWASVFLFPNMATDFTESYQPS